MNPMNEVDELLALLKDGRTDEERADAADVLGEIGDGRSVAPLLAALAEDTPLVQISAALALGEMRALKAVGPLVQTLDSEEADLRGAACLALGQIGDVGGMEGLIARTTDHLPAVRGAAAWALGALADARAWDALERLSRLEGDSEAGLAAREALGRIRAAL